MTPTEEAPTKRHRRKRTAERIADGIIRRDGSYWAAIEFPRKENGARDRRWFGPFISKEAATEERDKRRHESHNGLNADPRKLRFDELADRWLEYKEAQNLSPSMMRQYREAVNLRIKPAFADCAVKSLTRMKVSTIDTRLANAKRLDGRQGDLSDRSIQIVKVTLRSLLKQAASWGVVSDDLHRAVQNRQVRRDHVEFLTSESIPALLDAGKAKSPLAFAVISTAAGCGLRRAELCGLQWRDLDLEEGALRVERGVQKHEGKFLVLPPKTKLSRRTLTIPKFALDAIKAHRAALMGQRLAAGLGRPADEHFVFGNALGEPMDPTALTNLVRAVTKAAGLPESFHLHSLRHAFASLQLEAGTDLKLISESLGHSSIKLTADTYSHIAASLKREAADRLDKLVNRALSKPKVG